MFPSPDTPAAIMDAVRSALQPVTHNLPAPIRDLGVSIIGEHCYKSLLLDINVEDVDCIKLGLSKGIGLGIVGVSSIVKLPQIRKLTSSQSGEGISVLSYLLETASYLVSLAYNYRNQFPFSTYGETALIMGQNVIITVLVLNYTGRASLAALFVTALAVALGTLFAGSLVDMQTLGYLQAGAGVLSVASKVPQILAIWSEGGTGQLSAFAVSRFLLAPCGNPREIQVLTCVIKRSSTTSPAPSPASSPPSRRSTTSSSCTTSSPASSSTPSSRPRWRTTGTRPPRRPRASRKFPSLLPLLQVPHRLLRRPPRRVPAPAVAVECVVLSRGVRIPL